MPLIDAHNHLQEEILEPLFPEVLARARAAGVTCQVVNGTGEQDWARVAELARDDPGLIPCFGLHPWFVGERSGDWRDVLEVYLTGRHGHGGRGRETAPTTAGDGHGDRAQGSAPATATAGTTTTRAATAGIGEIGLDRLQAGLDREAQELVFREQLRLAQRLGRPVMVHCLRAWGWLLEILREAGPLPAGLQLHGYGGAPDLLPELAARGAYFSFAGTVLDPARKRARAALLATPRDRLLLETDAPAMPPPATYRLPGTEYNEPGNLPLIVAGVAELLGMSAEELAELTWANAQRFLGELACPTSSS